jgi:hypothetical protein
MATSLVKSFNSQISETVQQVCDTDQTDCFTRLRTKVNINIKRPGNKVTLPGGTVHVNPILTQFTNPVDELILNTIAPFNINVQNLLVFRKAFTVNGSFTLDVPNTSDGISPDTDEVHLLVGPSFGITIPPGKFTRLLQGKLFTFVGKLDDGLDVAASFARGANPAGPWIFAAAVAGVNLQQQVPLPPAQTSVQLLFVSNSGDSGKGLVAASIFPRDN